MEIDVTEAEAEASWRVMCDLVAEQMKVFTRPYVSVLAGGAIGQVTEIGTGTFLEKDGVHLLTCEHVAKFKPTAIYVDADGSTNLEPGAWRMEPNPSKDVAIAPVAIDEWQKVSNSAQPLPFSKFAQRHNIVDRELLFFRGIAGENAYISSSGADVILTGYCSQEKMDTGDSNILEILWKPDSTTVASGLSTEGRSRFKYDNPAGFSGSLVWNTRFVELGCDFSKWTPSDAVVTGLLRRFDPETNTLLVWRVEHLLDWL